VGAAAIVFPMVTTLVATLLTGWVFLFAGGFMFLGAFSVHGTGPFFGALLWSLLTLAAGAFLVFNPLAGMVALTIVIAAMFMLQGAAELVFALETRPHAGWVWMLLSALASIVIGVAVAGLLPAVSLVVLGLLLGINFLSTGLAFIFLSMAARKAA
jgi:uncharacterized membrane protein HdeD (DUF308 family)